MTANPALADLQFLAGPWDMELSDASFLPDHDAKVHGSVTFEWIAHVTALVMKMGDAATQGATWIIGRDDSGPDYLVRYADDRGVSRVYRMSLTEGSWRMWRDKAEISGSWQKSVDGRHHLGARLPGPV